MLVTALSTWWIRMNGSFSWIHGLSVLTLLALSGAVVAAFRGTIVNLDEVAASVRDDAGPVTLRLRHRKESLPVSRVYAELFRQM